jgi:CBS-domain-containing membrane protein
MRAIDVMTEEVVCINVNESVFDAAELLLSNRISAMPVIDDKGAIVGIVSEADLMHRAETNTAAKRSWLTRLMESDAAAAHDFVVAHSRRVSDMMTRKVVTASEDATLGELVDLMEHHGVKRIPVVRERVPVGIVSRADLLRVLMSREPNRPLLQPADRALRNAVIEALRNRPWSSRWPINVVASDGVVHLWGFVDGDEARKACRVAAENVPGVRRVKSHLRSIPAMVGMGV